MKIKNLPKMAEMGYIDRGKVHLDGRERNFYEFRATIGDLIAYVAKRRSPIWTEILEREVLFIFDTPKRKL